MRRFALIAIAILGLAARAEALTIRDIIELSRSGLGEDVLLALIEVDRGIYGIDTDTLKSLKAGRCPRKGHRRAGAQRARATGCRAGAGCPAGRRGKCARHRRSW